MNENGAASRKDAGRAEASPPTAPTLRESDRSPAGALGPAGSPPQPVSRPSTDDLARGHARLADPEDKRSVRRAMAVGAWVWPLFFVIDVYLALVVYPGTPLVRCAIFRLVGEVGIFAVFALSRQEGVTERRLKAANALICLVVSVLISILAIDFGGLASPYIHGISLVILVEALAVPAPWRDTLWFALPCALSFPVVGLVLSPFHPMLAAQLHDPQLFALFGAHYSMTVATAVISAVSGQVGHNARVQLRKARRLGRYRLEARIGEGGMNEVWLAWDESLKRDVALKILRAGRDVADGVAVRFEREALATSRLTSPNTIRVFDFGASDDGFSYIAMEYLAGADLQQLVRERGPMPASRAIAFALQTCRSLAEAHAAGIIHRDIKPANLFAARFGDEYDVLKVLDFGIARLVAASVDATATQSVRGTPAYMAPECWSGADADERSDVYALGATLCTLLTGQPPFAGTEPALLVRAHLLDAPPAPSVVRGGAEVPPALDAIVLRCLAKAPEDRFADVRALERALAEVSASLPPWTNDDARVSWMDRTRAAQDRSSAVPQSSVPSRRGTTSGAGNVPSEGNTTPVLGSAGTSIGGGTNE